MGFLEDWQYRKKLTIDSATVGSTLTDTPVLVQLDNVNFDFTKAEEDASDIRFTTDDGETLLKFERESHILEGAGIDSFTKLMLHMNGTDTSTTFTDDSLSPHSPTAVGNAQIDIDQSKFGSSSGLFDGSGDYVSVPDSTDWDFGNGDFTIDFWTRFSDVSGNQGWCGRQTSGTSYFYFAKEGSSIRFRDYNSGNIINLSLSWSPSADTWYHIAAVRSGSTITIYVDGVSIGSAGVGATSFLDRSDPLFIGSSFDTAYHLNGWMDEFRWSKGIARWTSNFSVPTAEYGSTITGGSANYWVKVPSISNSVDTDIYLYYGNSSASDNEDANNTWNSNYSSVLHLKEVADGTADEYIDSTSNDNDGQGGGGTASQVPTSSDSLIYKGADLDGSDDYILIGDDASLRPTNISLSCWIKLDSLPGAKVSICAFRRTAIAPAYGLELLNDDTINFFVFTSSSDYKDVQSSTALSSGVWYNLVGTWDGTTAKIYINGSDDSNTSGGVGSGNIDYTSSQDFIIGDSGSLNPITGIIDEVRINSQVLTDDYISFQYDSSTDNIFSFGSEESQILYDINTDIRAKLQEALYDIDLDVRLAELVEQDIDTDIRVQFTPAIEDIDVDIRVGELVEEDINTDIRIQFNPVVEDIDTDIRIAELTIEDLDLDVRALESIISDINTDIRVRDFVFYDIDTDIRAISGFLGDISTDIRIRDVINTSTVEIRSAFFQEGYYLSSDQVTIEMEVYGAIKMQFKNESGAWSTLEDVDNIKEWTLSPGDGDKSVFLRFQDIQGVLTDGLTVITAVVSTTTATAPTIEAFTDDTAVTSISDSTYQIDNRPFFRWAVPIFDIPYRGFSVALDGVPDDGINVQTDQVIRDGILVTKATPFPEMTLDISAGNYYINEDLREFEVDSVTLSDGGVQDRIDVVALSLVDGVINVIEGDESATPEIPETFTDSINLATAYIPAGATTIASVTLTDISPRYLELTRYLYEDISEGQHTLQVKGIMENGTIGDIGTFNIWIANPSPEMGEIDGYTDGTKVIGISSGIYQTADDTPYFEWTAAPNEPGPITYYYTTDGSEPTAASSSTASTNLNLGPFSEGTTIIKIKPRDDTTGIFGSTKEFIFVYGSQTFTNDTAVIGGNTVLKQSLKEIQVKEISWDFNSARTCTIFQPVEFDETLPFSEGQTLSVVYGSNNDTVFRGKIKRIERAINETEEGVTYHCVGPRGELNEQYAIVDDSDFGDTARIVFEDESLTSAITSITNKAGDIISSIQNFPTGANITDEFTAQSISQVLDGIYSKTNYAWYIQPNGVLVSIDKSATNPEQAKFGVLGTTVNSISPQYNVMSSNLQFDVSRRYNKAIIEGAKKKEKITLKAHCITKEETQELLNEEDVNEDIKYKVYKLDTKWPVVKALHTSVSYARITGFNLIPLHNGPVVLGELLPAHSWFIQFVGPVDICKANNITRTLWQGYGKTSYSDGSQDYTPLETPKVENLVEIQGNLGAQNTIRFNKAMYTYWPKGSSTTNVPGVTSAARWNIETPDPYQTIINTDVLKLPEKRCASVEAEVLIETIPLRVEVTVAGTASSLSKTLRIVNESFQYNEDPDDFIDDTARMTEFAEDMLEKYKDIKVNGSITLDTVDLSWDLDNTVNLINTNQGSWSTLNAKVIGISYNFDENTTTLEITSEFL